MASVKSRPCRVCVDVQYEAYICVDVMQGQDAIVLCYGAAGSGKSYTLEVRCNAWAQLGSWLRVEG